MATAASAVPGGSVDLALEGCTVIVTGAGSGIGLTIARELLVANGGQIGVERTGPNGTTFAITLPRGTVPPPL